MCSSDLNNESGEEIAAKTELPAPEAPTAPPAEAPKGVESPPPTPPPEVQPPAAKPAENPPAARPAAEPKPAAKAEPKPVAKAEPKPAEKPPSGKRLVTDAWKAVDAGEYDKAHGLFDRAFEASGSATALYGRGYTNEKLGDKVSAADDYCHALAVGGLDVDMTREVEGGLRRVGRACN